MLSTWTIMPCMERLLPPLEGWLFSFLFFFFSNNILLPLLVLWENHSWNIFVKRMSPTQTHHLKSPDVWCEAPKYKVPAATSLAHGLRLAQRIYSLNRNYFGTAVLQVSTSAANISYKQKRDNIRLTRKWVKYKILKGAEPVLSWDSKFGWIEHWIRRREGRLLFSSLSLIFGINFSEAIPCLCLFSPSSPLLPWSVHTVSSVGHGASSSAVTGT